MCRKILFLIFAWGLFTCSSCFANPVLVTHWKMNDNADSYTVVDALGTYDGAYKDKDGTINTDTGDSTGVVGGALDFDGPEGDGGTGIYIDSGDPFQSTFQGSFSISLWFKATDGQPPNTGWLFGVTDTGVLVWIILGANGTLDFEYNSNSNSSRFYYYTDPLANGQLDWIHLVMVVDSTIRAIGGLKGYMNGRLLPYGAAFKGDTTDVVSADYVSDLNPFIGAENDSVVTGEYNGLLDNVTIFSSALTQEEIDILYNNGSGTENIADLDSKVSPRRSNLSSFPLRRRYEW